MLKLIAICTMVIDHIGFLFFPDQEWLRAIGRLTMPIFAYAIARGFYYTRDPRKYLVRLSLLAIVSQLPFTLLSGLYTEVSFASWVFSFPILNMVAPWALAVLMLLSKSYYIAPLALITLLLPMDYTGVVAFLPMAIYYFWFKNRSILLALLTTVGLLSVIALASPTFQWFALLAIPLIVLLERWDSKVRLNRWFFYSFYPAHMLILVGGKAVLG